MARHFIVKSALFVLLPVLVLELAIRVPLRQQFAGTERLENIYLSVGEQLGEERLDYLFIGSSRVAAAIDAEAFAAHAPRPGVRVINAGQGYSTPIMHYLALRDLFARHPEPLRGTTILVEAPKRLPDYQSWSGNWSHKEWPTLLSPHLTAATLGEYWAQADEPFGTKVQVSSAAVSRTVHFWRYIRDRVEGVVNARAGSLGLAGADQPSAAAPSDLTNAGGIRTDSAGVALARQKAQEEADRKSEVQEQFGAWEKSVWADLVELARANGSQVVFFEMPVSTVQAAEYDSAVRRQDQEAFQAWAHFASVPVLQVPFSTTDADFPDLWHLRQSRAAEFTAEVAASYNAVTSLAGR